MKPPIFLVFCVGDKFVRVDKHLKLSLTTEIVSYWMNKRVIKTWKSTILHKYPNAEIKEAKMVLK
ncbi:MAG: hypothetical protein RIR48_2529 [Bacteroidota bacterium]|jgi:hypothetical protein